MINPSTPYMHGQIKTYKTNHPVRPIISTVGSATYELAKWLMKLLSPYVGTVSNSFIKNKKNSVDLV